MSDPHWIEKMHMKQGALTKTAKAKGLVSKKTGKITKAGLHKMTKSKNPKTAKRAQVALTLARLRAQKK